MEERIPNIPEWKQITIQTYDRVASAYHDSLDDLKFWAYEIAKFKKLLGRTGKIVDIGCGTGRDAPFFIGAGFEYIGIDASKGMLQEASSYAPDAVFKQMDFLDLDFPDNNFDAFWAVASFLHVPKEEISQVLLEARRVLKSGGIGFISVKKITEKNNADGLIEDNRRGGMTRYMAYYKKEEFESYLTNVGFEVIKISNHIEIGGKETDWLCYFVKKP